MTLFSSHPKHDFSGLRTLILLKSILTADQDAARDPWDLHLAAEFYFNVQLCSLKISYFYQSKEHKYMRWNHQTQKYTTKMYLKIYPYTVITPQNNFTGLFVMIKASSELIILINRMNALSVFGYLLKSTQY